MARVGEVSRGFARLARFRKVKGKSKSKVNYPRLANNGRTWGTRRSFARLEAKATAKARSTAPLNEKSVEWATRGTRGTRDTRGDVGVWFLRLLLFFELGPAGEELVEGGFGLLEFGLGGDEGGGIGLNSRVVEGGLRGG